MQLTKEIIVIGCGASAVQAEALLTSLQKACDKFEINTPARLGAFLGNIGIESAGLSHFVENLNYSAQGLANTWKFHFAENPHADHLLPNSLALAIQHKPELIANSVYCNKNGNGAQSSGDGWKYRGRGAIGVTFKANYEAVQKATGLKCVDKPELLEEPDGAMLSAAHYFASNGCNALADEGKFSLLVERINGAMPCKANQGDLRLSRGVDVVKALSAATQSSADTASFVLAAETASSDEKPA